MRLQHLKQIAGVLSNEDPARGAKTMIITEVERLRWRIWNGKAKDAQISIDRIHALLPSSRASLLASCGGRGARWPSISAPRAPIWSTTPNGTGPGCGSARR